MVREAGLEPARPIGHQNLNLARLPFRHSRAACSLPGLPAIEASEVALARTSEPMAAG